MKLKMKKSIFKNLFFALIAVVLVGCFDDKDKENTFTPTAIIDSPATGTTFSAGVTINFQGSGTDSDGSISQYAWDFGDGNSSALQNPTHSYSSTGSYSITLTVTDDGGLTGTKTISIEITGIGTVSGIVKDAVADSLLQGVNVELFNGTVSITSVTTDVNGAYSLSVAAGSGYKAVFSKTDFMSASYDNVSVTANATTYLETVLQIDSLQMGDGIVSGTITNAFSGAAVDSLTVELFAGINTTTGSSVDTTTTNASGLYIFSSLPTGIYTAELSKSGFSTSIITIISIGGTTRDNQNGSVTPVLATGEIRIVLTWGATPSDLDSHMTGPKPGESERFHVYFLNRTYYNNSSVYVGLDTDDMSSYGPETITIYEQTDGAYRYSVNNYSGGGNTVLPNSSAQVKVYQGSTISTFNVPASQSGTLWTVFELNGSVITPINTITTGSTYAAKPNDTSDYESANSDAELIGNLPSK